MQTYWVNKKNKVQMKEYSGVCVCVYQWQQNTLYPKDGRFCENNFLKLLIGSQPIIEGRSLICGRLG